jgi:hypothetical protein
MVGNMMDIDSKGFLSSSQSHPSASHIMTRLFTEL